MIDDQSDDSTGDGVTGDDDDNGFTTKPFQSGALTPSWTIIRLILKKVICMHV